jgi:SCF-associated factor 1
MANTQHIGVIADMQCGGWSTTILTSKGTLYTAGVLNGMVLGGGGPEDQQPAALRFPAGFPYNSALAAYEEPTIAIRQFSAGRTHILGLSDSGRIWAWYNVNKPALHVKFFDVDITEASSGQSSPANTPLFGRVKQVVAGWSRSSAYIYGRGIIVWDIVERQRGESDETDTMLVMESSEIPQTAYQRPKGASRDSDEDRALADEIGAVLNYIILEHFAVFVTDIGKVFCGRFGEKNQVQEILELRALRNDSNSPIDVQGSFRRFAVFKGGEVITSTQNYLEECWNGRRDPEKSARTEGLQKIPALQHNAVISIAFGDYHFLALHSTGRITSYGTECNGCGALGLGFSQLAYGKQGHWRGLKFQRSQAQLLPHAYTHGRQVWFQPEKLAWLTFMSSGGKDPEESKERMVMCSTEDAVQGELSEWFEQEGRDWDKRVETDDDDGLGAYFALSVSAAGWHSGAVVLVNQDLADRVRDSCIVEDPEARTRPKDEPEERVPGSWIVATFSNWVRNFLGLRQADQQRQRRKNTDLEDLDVVAGRRPPGMPHCKYTWMDTPFPRLKLSDGREMPGTVEFNEWRYGRPTWDLDFVNLDV